MSGDLRERLTDEIDRAECYNHATEITVRIDDLRALLDTAAVPQPETAECTCYPGGFTADTYEGPQRDCSLHGEPAQPSAAAAHDEPTIEDVLAKHQDFRFMRNTIGGYRRDWWECTCRWSLPLPTDAEVSKAHRAHVAQVLRQAIKDGAR